MPRRRGKYYIKLAIDGDVKQITVAQKGEPVGLRMFTLCRVYAQLKIGGEHFIGSTKGTFESLLAESASGGQTTSLFVKYSNYAHELQIVLHFTIAAIEGPAIATQQQMDEAQARGTVDGPIAIYNDYRPIAMVWGPFLDRVEQLTRIVDQISEIHPYAKITWSIISATHQIVLVQKERDKAIDHLVAVMNDVYSFVQEAEPLKNITSHRQIVADISQQTIECAYFIHDYSIKKRTARNFMSDTDSKVQQYEAKFSELKLAFQGRAILQTEITVIRIMDTVENNTEEIDLKDIVHAGGARFDPENVCLPHTRDEVIDEIHRWINNSGGNNARIFYLSGIAGSGKSAIAHTIVHLYEQLGRLGSSFCFDRADQANRRPDNIFSTIARDLADLEPQRKHALWLAVKDKLSLRTTWAPREQFEQFILIPAKDVKSTGLIVIVIDALDECGDEDSRKIILSILGNAVKYLPSNFRILITSRPESDIENALALKNHVFCKRMDTIDIKSTEHDISLYFQAQLSDVRGLDRQWPNKSWCPPLIEKSEGLLQWAFTECHFIKGNGKSGIAQLNIFFVISITNEQAEQHAAVRPPHTSFRDFLTDAYRNKSFYVELTPHHGKFFLASMRAMKITLKFNICELNTSHIRNIDVPDLTARVEKAIAPSLSHAGRFWADHLLETPCDHVVLEALWYFMDNQFLYWLEVLRFVKHVNHASRMLTSMSKWMKTHDQDVLMATDMGRFLSALTSIIPQSAPRIYLLALSFTPTVNATGQSFKLFWPGTPTVVNSVAFSPDNSRIISGSDDCMIRIWDAQTGGIVLKDTHWVTSVKFAPNGTSIASASDDTTIRVWDAQTGDIISGPFEGHTDGVNCVAFSADGPFEGYTSRVNSVVFTSDGTRIISGSDDQTIRVWDTQTGDTVLAPWQAYANWVNSVAISSYDCRIASGSEDHTIRTRIVSGSHDHTIRVTRYRVWDVQTGILVSGPLQGHTDSINCISVSPGGARIVSGSHDATLRVWDTQTGNILLGPIQGHTNRVTSAAFSPDGTSIVSGSHDCSILVWDSQTGDIKSGPFEGHTDRVRSVSFSPNGTRIISASSDLTIRIWDLQMSTIASDSQRHIHDKSRSSSDAVTGRRAVLVHPVLRMTTGPEFRAALLGPAIDPCWPGNTTVIARVSTKLDLTSFVHGDSWHLCKG
ncbi:hypothetical protein PILCRDRAFT_3429 [Piloderma croceum F 1598]|uniref:NACHT domain-containing protein n=1 Tax=Piloderma croceum (strain F 1598) TaxID=765440 RepID=A0A0C3G9L4_PILCF|nr:hypothetical protein PILCRDRAFT_3429 [Piloderma croceum F 1598]